MLLKGAVTLELTEETEIWAVSVANLTVLPLNYLDPHWHATTEQ